jgi:hypothetical protein
LTKKVSELQKVNTLLAQNQANISDIDIAVASAPSPDIFVKQIQGISGKNSVNLIGLAINDIILVGTPKTTKVSAQTSPLPDGANEMGYTISVKGDFTGIAGFIGDLEKLRVISTIDSVTISSSVTDTGRVIVAIISGRVPYLGSK